MSERPPSRAKSSSGRETSFGLPTSGHKGWMPVLLKDGSHSKRPPQEGYKNVVTNQEFIPPGGWNDAPPGLTGEPVRLASDAYKEGWDRIWGSESANQPNGS
jgi:hypothetical protein